MKFTLFVALSAVLAIAGLATATPRTHDRHATVTSTGRASSSTLQNAIRDVKDATKVARRMESQPDVATLLHRAKGVFIVPGRAALVPGASAPSGVLVVREGKRWSNPVFYDLAAAGVRSPARASAGSIAMVLMTKRAVDHFKKTSSFSLDTKGGLKVVSYTKGEAAASGRPDVVVWSTHTAGASITGRTISTDRAANEAYYDSSKARPAAILDWSVNVARPVATRLRNAIGHA